MNPVARRELQERFRTMRAPVLISLWVMAAGGLTFLSYLFARSAVRGNLFGFAGGGFGTVVASASMGRFILHTVLLGLLTAVVFVVPGQAAVAIVGERERQTLPLLQVSQLSAGRIVVGKLLSAIAYILLLLVATTPLLVIPVLLGGVSIMDVLGGVGMVAAAAVMFGATSIWMSARARSAQGAVLGSYLLAVAFVFGTMALLVTEIIVVDADTGRTQFDVGIPRDEGRELFSTWLNPYVGVVDASTDVLAPQGEIIGSPYAPFRAVLLKRQGFAISTANELFSPWGFGRFGGFVEPGLFIEDVAVGIPNDLAQVAQTGRFPPIRTRVWWRTLLIEAAVTALALWGAARMIRVPRRSLGRVRVGRKAKSNAS